LVARARHASKMIELHGYTVAHAKTGIESVSPWVRIERDAWAQAVKLGEHFGLTPVARTRLGLAVLKGRSLLQELEAGLGDGLE
jgi:P27 family predicted phage terminase small subunit